MLITTDLSVYKNKISEVVLSIANRDERKFNLLQSNSRITFNDIMRAINEYGDIHLIEIPKEGFDLADAYSIAGLDSTIRIEMPLWTKEEGRSDLYIYFHCSCIKGFPEIGVADIYVP